MGRVSIPSRSADARTAFPGTASDRRLNQLGYDLPGEHRRAVEFAGWGAGDRVLDVATGSGRMAFALATAGCQVVSGDISDEVVQEARERIGALTRGAIEFRVMDAIHLDVPDASVMGVVAANAMHHMEEPERVLEEMTRVLSGDGRLVVVEFNEHGFEVIDQVHQVVHHRHHGRGGISAQAICEFLRSRFEKVEHHVLALNDVWIASGRRGEPTPAHHGRHGQCFACGPANPFGLRLRFERDGADGVIAHYTVEEKYQGYDGVVQGGIVSLLLDSAMTNCLFWHGIQAMTGRLAVRFRMPVRTGVPLTVRARLLDDECTSRLGKAVYTLGAVLEQGGRTRASATGTFVRVLPG
jgi:SAM-dependent methyltransferase